MKELKLGVKAKDKVTGFVGIVAGRSVYLYGCDQLMLSPQCKKGNEFNNSRWFDEPRIAYVGKGIDPKSVQEEKKPGGDIPAPTK